MALSQVQIIQSLAEALSWFEKELGWGVEKSELRHLSGRIGELYAAMITRGQMALAANQQGYDVVSSEGERISVKTITTSKYVAFNERTFDQVDRVIILRINVDETEASIEELLDCPATEAIEKIQAVNGRLLYYPSQNTQHRDLSALRITAEAEYQGHTIRQLENGTILILRDGEVISPAKPILRTFAKEFGVDLLNGNGNPKNTRTLGADVISALRNG